MSPANLPYQPVTEPGYAAAATTFEVHTYDDGALTVNGPCPRCGALLEVPVFDKAFRAVGGSSGPVLIICNCEDHQHPGRPAGRRGCGAYWKFLL
ncbi:hypothetical protein [Kitasatospora sp. NPDC090091]|uniref:hypothetical protein n=1 Tax=Kitasatospora sp. NPDC090091 TaxID=3364081 RepID=UPI003818344D